MPETTVKFVHGVGSFVVSVHVEGLVSAQDHMFASVTGVPNGDVGFSVEVLEPFQSCERMGFTLRMSSTDGFGHQRTFLHVFGVAEEVAGGGDGDTSFQWVETADLFEFFAKDLAGSFQEEYIRFAVGHEFCLEIEDIIGIVTVPCVEFPASVDGDPLGIIVFLVG